MVKFGNVKETMKMCCAALHQHQYINQELPGSRAENNKTFTHNGGYMIPTHNKICLEVTIHFEKLLNDHGKNEHLENDTPDFCLNREVKLEV